MTKDQAQYIHDGPNSTGRKGFSSAEKYSPVLDNRYRLLDMLGRGGMGSVYRALDLLTGETVALKRVVLSSLQPALAPEMRLALAHEFQALASLRHPHIIAVRDYGFETSEMGEPQPYFTMDLLADSRPITAAGQLLSTDGKVDLLLQLLYALAYLHRRHIIHRDLKPGNILVTGREVKVLDFGLATVAGQDAPASGTLFYMAPEVLRGEPANPASDLYAAGVIAYELLAGWHPFAHSAHSVIEAILQEEPDWSFVDVEPGLRDVVQRLLAKSAGERYQQATAVIEALSTATGRALAVETEAIRESFLQAAPFVGREQELAQLEAALAASRSGSGGAWLVAGESGVGKSRLLQELRTRVLVQGGFALPGQAAGTGGAYHLWRESLRRLILLSAPDDLEAAVLKPLIPDIADLLGRPVADAPLLEAQQAQKRLMTTVTALLRRSAAERPILLLLEDIHWADRNSLELLEWLSRTIAQAPVLIVATFRQGEQPQLPAQLPEMRLLPLARLSSQSIAFLSEAMLGPAGRRPHLVSFLQQETEGNTFFVVEVVRALAEEAGRLDRVAEMPLPLHVFAGGMRQMVRRRLRRIPTNYQPLLQLAAVAGRRLDRAVLEALVPEADFEQWLTAGANAFVLALQDGQWHFAHDKLREGILEELEPQQRRLMHRRVARVIERVYGAELPSHYVDLAYHLGQAGERKDERHYLLLAAETAQLSYANAASIEYYERLLPLLDDEPEGENRIEVLLKLGKVLKVVGRWDEAEARFQQALDGADRIGGTKGSPAATLLADTWQALGNLWRSRGEYSRALAWLEQAQVMLEALGDHKRLSRVLIEIGNAYYQQGAYKAARTYLEQALAFARAVGDQAETTLALHSLGSVAYSQADYAAARARYEESLAVRRVTGDKEGMASAYNNLGNVAYIQGDYEAAQAYYEESLSLRREVGDQWSIAASLNNLGIIPYHQEADATAQQYWQESLTLRRALGDKWGIAFSLDNLGLVASAQGDYTAARAMSGEALALRREIGDNQGIAISLGNLANVELLQKEYPEAQTHYEESLRLVQEMDDKRGIVYALLGVAGVAAEREKSAAQSARAVRLVAVAHALLKQIGATMERDEQDLYQRIVAATGQVLDEAAWTAAWAEGEVMAVEQAVAYALSG